MNLEEEKMSVPIKIIHKELSYEVVGLLFKVHGQLGRFCREKQYGDVLEKLLLENGMPHKREVPIPVSGVKYGYTNIADFIVKDAIVIDLKAKTLVTKEDYYQMNRYLEATKLNLGMIVNFRNKFLKPIRVIRANS